MMALILNFIRSIKFRLILKCLFYLGLLLYGYYMPILRNDSSTTFFSAVINYFVSVAVHYALFSCTFCFYIILISTINIFFEIRKNSGLYWPKHHMKREPTILFRKFLYAFWVMEIRHLHLSFDIFNVICRFITTIATFPRLAWRYNLVRVHDFDLHDDPAWPNCSILHTVSAYYCNECRKDNRIEIYRISLLRRKIRSICFWPIHEKFTSGMALSIRAYQSGGFIFTYVEKTKDHFPRTLDIYHIRSQKIRSFDTKLIQRKWQPFYFFRDTSMEKDDQKSIYIRMLFVYRHSNMTGRSIGQALYEFPIDQAGRPPLLVSSQGMDFWQSWEMISSSYVLRSLSKVGLVLKMKNAQGIDGEFYCVYDLKSKELKFLPVETIAVDEEDREWFTCVARFWKGNENKFLFTSVVNGSEILMVRRDWTVRRTPLQPISLKNLCLQVIHSKNIIGLKKTKTKSKWGQETGIELDQHFETV